MIISKRNSNIEILRIVSMLLIILFHGTRESCWALTSATAKMGGVLLGSWGLLGVDLFVIISAWFLVDQKFKTKRIVNIILEVFMYVLFFYVVFVGRMIYKGAGFSEIIESFGSQIIHDFLQPFWSNTYWFVTAYLFMILLSPLLNKILTLPQETTKYILIITCFVPIYAQFGSNAGSLVCDSLYFAYLYLFVGYFKKYGIALIEKLSKVRYIIITAILVIATRCFITFVDQVQNKLPGIISGLYKVIKLLLADSIGNTGRNSFVMAVLALLIFVCVVRKPAKNYGIANYLAGFTLGIYCFHESSVGINVCDYANITMRRIGFYTDNAWFVVEFFVASVGIFLLCLGVEIVRDKLLQKPIMKLIEKKLQGKFDKIDEYMNR